jgi:hypothetical protein
VQIFGVTFRLQVYIVPPKRNPKNKKDFKWVKERMKLFKGKGGASSACVISMRHQHTSSAYVISTHHKGRTVSDHIYTVQHLAGWRYTCFHLVIVSRKAKRPPKERHKREQESVLGAAGSATEGSTGVSGVGDQQQYQQQQQGQQQGEQMMRITKVLSC